VTSHQKKQIEVISKIENQIQSGSLSFSTVSPVEDFEKDPRICLTSVHLPSGLLKKQVLDLLKPLKDISPKHYYFPSDSIHITIKNIRVINYPPHFSSNDIVMAKKVFSETIPNHFQFKIYFYKLLLFPNNLALVGTTDKELDNIIFDLDQKLKESGIADDKHYINSKYFFCNITLARFSKPISDEFRKKVMELSNGININPYIVNSASLLISNAVLHDPNIIGTWNLKKRSV
jgi:hypothetical protein